jgi:branched-chain amino acid transport system ATP-binding protein
MTAAADVTPLIAVRDLTARYGHIEALRSTALHVAPGEFVTILGPNGAGKTTLLRAITRLIASTGQIVFNGRDVTHLRTHELAGLGIIMVQEGRGLFGDMSVRENLQLGAYKLYGPQAHSERQLEKVFSLFPRLRERIDQTASSMSGGEQQMLAVGRALMANPKLLILDEPSLGLAPRVASEILSTLGALNKEGLGILLVEQKAPLALKLAQRVYILASGSVRAELPTQEIESHHDLARYYFT